MSGSVDFAMTAGIPCSLTSRAPSTFVWMPPNSSDVLSDMISWTVS